MGLLKDIKFQTALVSLIVAGVLFFMPEVDEKSLIEVVGAVVFLIFGGHSVADYRKKAKK
ncbi:MAG: hypothetical protein ACYSQZ_09660 [Planctomycetota bacterium]|jgi:hypothetical protein